MSDTIKKNQTSIDVPSYLSSEADYGIALAADCGSCQSTTQSCGSSESGSCSACEGLGCMSSCESSQGCSGCQSSSCQTACQKSSQSCSQSCSQSGCGTSQAVDNVTNTLGYLGVNGVARKLKGGYIGVVTNAPTYTTATNLTAGTINAWFTVTNGDPYSFAPTVIETALGNRTAWISENGGYDGTIAQITLTAQDNIDISLYYSYSSEANYDKFSFSAGGYLVESDVSGTTTEKSWSGSLTAGQSLVFTYVKDGSQDGNDDRCYFMIDSVSKVSGYSDRPVARKIKKIYMGVNENAPVYQLRHATSNGQLGANGIIPSQCFTVTNGSTYYFALSGNQYVSNNGGINNTTAQTELTAIYDIPNIEFTYSYGSEKNYDCFSLKVANTYIENEVSGPQTTKTYRGSLRAGESIVFTYDKDGSQHENGDQCTFSISQVSWLYPTGETTTHGVAKLCWEESSGIIKL